MHLHMFVYNGLLVNLCTHMLTDLRNMHACIEEHNHTQYKPVNEFRCYEAKVEESEKAGSYWEPNPGHLA